MSFVAMNDGFDFRKKDATLRNKTNVDEESDMEVDGKEFSSLYQQWKSEGENTNAKPLIPNFNFHDKNYTKNPEKPNHNTDSITHNPLFNKNPGFLPTNLNDIDDALDERQKHFRQNEQLPSDLTKANVHDLTKSFEKPLNGIIQPDQDVVNEYRDKYIENRPKNNFQFLRENSKNRVSPDTASSSTVNDWDTNNMSGETDFMNGYMTQKNDSFNLKDFPKATAPLFEPSSSNNTSTPRIDITQKNDSYNLKDFPKTTALLHEKSSSKNNTSAPLINADDPNSDEHLIYESAEGFKWDRNRLESSLPQARDLTPKLDKSRSPINRSESDAGEDSLNGRSRDGWSRTEQSYFMPGPSTQSLEYFPRNNSSKSLDYSNNNPHHFNNLQIVPLNDEKPKSKKHKMSFRSKKSRREKTDDNLPNPLRHRSSSNLSVTNVLYNNGLEHEIESNGLVSPQNFRKEMIFSPSTPRKKTDTNLNELNFTKMSANVRRSKSDVNGGSTLVQRKNIKRSSFQKTNNTEVSYDGTYLAISGQNPVERNVSQRSRSTLSSGSNNSSAFEKSLKEEHDKKTTTVLLAKDWTGKIISSSKTTKQVYDYGLKIDPPQLASSGKNLNALVFRNPIPINEVKPTDERDNAMKSLRSLDRRLKNESDTSAVLYKDSLDWMHESQPTTPRSNSELYYRESKCEITNLPELSKNVLDTGWNKGQNMRVHFYHHLHKVTTVVNQMIGEIPKKYFPFDIKPLSFQGEFEKKGENTVDLYLVLRDMTSLNCHINFVLRKTLGAYAILDNYNYEKDFKMFCAQNADNGMRILSASNLMIVFAYIVNTKIRSRFEHTSKRRKKSVPFDAEIQFERVSEGEVRFKIYFPDDDVKYDIGLLLALDVAEFPNVIESIPNRDWPSIQAKTELIKNGVHLLAKYHVSQNHSWTVTFLKTRKVLLGNSDNDNVATTLLLSLQVINEKVLSQRGCAGILLPVHFIMILFWTHAKYKDEANWNRNNLGERFIDILIALKRCLERKECRDFFFPTTNYLECVTEEQCENLALNVQEVLENPLQYVVTDEPTENLTSDTESNAQQENNLE